tara:strand:+ start:464 stop:874 length:411 start_codon:yes stop_codon:yes gene_type:complete
LPSQLENIYSGRAAEFYAAYILELMGLRVTHVDLPYDDLWVSHPDGRLIRVQVKSARKPYHRQDRYSDNYRYCFKVNEARKDFYDGIYLFVALDTGIVLARTWDDKPPISIKMNPLEFTTQAQEETLTREFKLETD